MIQAQQDGALHIDSKGFARELGHLKHDAAASLDISHYHHMRRLELVGRACTIVGFVLAIWVPIIAALFISMGLLTRWLLAHHICHGGYDKVPGIPARYTSKVFARGWRRFLDWFDWIHPEAWHYEHDFLHHYYTGEDHDPDLVERNADLLRRMRIPMFLKYVVLFLVAITWKFSYYAPNTLNALEKKKRFKESNGHRNHIGLLNFMDFRLEAVRRLWFSCWGPYFLFNFVAVPLAFLPLGQTASLNVLLARVLAELLHNLHMFMVIVPNHAGADVVRFDHHYRNREEFFTNQVLGSVNYHCGSEWLDYSQMWLNYQIEHHLFPRMTMLQYRAIQPKVKAICEKYGVPYLQESMFVRCRKLADICVGKTDMARQAPPPVTIHQNEESLAESAAV